MLQTNANRCWGAMDLLVTTRKTLAIKTFGNQVHSKVGRRETRECMVIDDDSDVVGGRRSPS